MPTDPGCINADEDFEYICGCLSALVFDSQVFSYFFAGDFNFHSFSDRYDFILTCLAPYRTVLADLCNMDDSTFTYVSDCHNAMSWI